MRNWKGQGIEMDELPNVKRWFTELEARPAFKRGVTVLADLRKPGMDEKAKEILFGATQYQKR